MTKPENGLSGAMHQHASQSDEGFARAALSYHVGVASQLPPLAHAHNCQGLGWIRSTDHPGKQWRRSFVGAMQSWVGREDPFPDFVRVSPQICCDVSYVVMIHESTSPFSSPRASMAT